MANTIDIIIKAVDQTGGTFNKLNSSFKSLTGFSLSAAGGIALAGAAIGKAIEYTKQAIAENDKYVSPIVDMARFTGDQVDQMSRLVQVADDAFLSQEQLNNAMGIGAKKGLDMSVEGIKKLADQYNALETQQEKNKLLNDNFGRSGLAMGKLLEQGASGITKNMEAVADNLVVTAKSQQITYEYKKSLDQLNDAFTGIKYTVAQGVIPTITDFNIVMAEVVGSTQKAEKTSKDISTALAGMGAVLLPLFTPIAALIFEITAGLDLWADSIIESDKVNEAYAGRLQAMADAAAAAKGAQEGLSGAVSSTTALFKELTTEMIYNAAAEGLSSEGALILAEKMGLVDYNTLAVLNSIESAKKTFGDTDALYGYVTAVNALYTALQNVQSASQISLVLSGLDAGSPFPTSNPKPGQVGIGQWTGVIDSATGKKQYLDSIGADGKKSYSYRAIGGQVDAGIPYTVGEVGPEMFVPGQSGSIIPAKSLSGVSASELEGIMARQNRVLLAGFTASLQKALA